MYDEQVLLRSQEIKLFIKPKDHKMLGIIIINNYL